MSELRITGGKRLAGRAVVGGAKNAVLPILAASIMAGAPVTLESFPMLTDTRNMLRILETLGCTCAISGDCARIDARYAAGYEMPGDLSKALRSSIFLMGPMLGRFKKAVVTYPGGCEIGQRPIDLHIRGLKALGVRIREAHGMIYCDGSNLRGGEVLLDFPSVGATENLMMAAALSPGRTVIRNAAREPEVLDLQRFMNAMGARVRGAGGGEIAVDGVDALSGATFKPMPDRIVAGTILAACAITGGEVTVEGAIADDLGAVLDKLRAAGCEAAVTEHSVSLRAPKRLRAFALATHPFPGFPTDMQAQFTALAGVADGASVIVENVFENRFGHVAELRRMGMDVCVTGRTAVVRGGRLTGARVTARDLRGGAALVLAGLAAEGVTEVASAALIDRGYPALEEILTALGADVVRL